MCKTDTIWFPEIVMALATVAIIGRPNVGKSSLLNAIAGSMISIVEPTAGVTRDRVSVIVEYNKRYFELVDTGGYGIVDAEQLGSHIASQIQQAIFSADVVVFVVDIREGLMPLDKKIAALLRKERLDVIVAANKADSASLFPAAGEFTRLGFGEALCISAVNNMNKNVLLERILEKIEGHPAEVPLQDVMKITIVGKRNVGKSTFVNAIVGEERVIVNEVPGTTRDAIDVRFERDGRTYVAIDTAGVRKKSRIADSIEFYSYSRATRSIRRADVVLFMIDATVPVGQVDKKLAKFISEEYKACILVINKWDLARDRASTADFEDYLSKVLPAMRNYPIAFTTAKDSKNVQSVLDLANEIFKQVTTRIPTAKLNQAVELIKQERPATSRKSGWPKIFYATQVSTRPVTLILFVNQPRLFDEKYKRFFVNRLRDSLPISEVPVRLLVRPRRPGRNA
ncbi:MAG: ribosome biogenesis GTPase Der [Planctomycetota bacterium]